MITDFSTYTNVGLHSMTFNGKNSLTDYGILLTIDTNTENVTARSIQDTIPFRQGVIDSSRIGGELFYEVRQLSYRFKILAETQAELAEKTANVKAWLGSDGSLEIYDSDYGNEWKFTNCYLKSIETEKGMNSSVPYLYLTAIFECDPYMIKGGTSKVLLYSFSANGNPAPLAIVNNSKIHNLTWREMVSASGNQVMIDIPDYAVQSSNRKFYVFGNLGDAAVNTALIIRGQTPYGGHVTMTTAYSGAFESLESGDKLVIVYNKDVSVDSVGGVSNALRSFDISDPIYKLEAYTEGTPTLKVNGSSQNISQSFSLPETAVLDIQISQSFFLLETPVLDIQNSGYGYYELWHDNTERRL